MSSIQIDIIQRQFDDPRQIQTAKRPSRPEHIHRCPARSRLRNEPRDRLAATRDHDFLPGFHTFHERGKVCFSLRDRNPFHGQLRLHTFTT